MSKETPERFFYHSFPRPRAATPDQVAKGLQILRSICRNGFLLVPERVSWSDPTGTRPGDRIHAFQRRLSFTELAPQELLQHAETFGPFALEYRIADLRPLGLLPVFYVPDSTNADSPTLDRAGVSLLGRLADATQVISSLVDTQNLTASTIELELRMRDGQVHPRRFDERETAAIRDYVRFLEGGPGQPLAEILGALRSLTSLFYPTGHPTYTGLLGYYRQREWRLFSGAFFNGQPTTTVATPEQQRELLEIDREFFSRTLPFPAGEATLAVKSHFMRTANGQHVLLIASRVIVPAVAEVAAQSILDEFGLGIRITRLEDAR